LVPTGVSLPSPACVLNGQGWDITVS